MMATIFIFLFPLLVWMVQRRNSRKLLISVAQSPFPKSERTKQSVKPIPEWCDLGQGSKFSSLQFLIRKGDHIHNFFGLPNLLGYQRKSNESVDWKDL